MLFGSDEVIAGNWYKIYTCNNIESQGKISSLCCINIERTTPAKT